VASKDAFRKASKRLIEEVPHFVNPADGELSLEDVGADGKGTKDRKRGFSFRDLASSATRKSAWDSLFERAAADANKEN
jgi:hypothetical protein